MYTKILFLLFSYFIVFSSNAQNSSITLSLKQVIQMGIDSSKTLKISHARMELAEAKYNQAIDMTIPSVKLSAGYTRLSNIDEPKFLFPGATEPVTLFPVYVNNYVGAISISETIFSGFRLKYARESQKLLRDAAKYENENDKTETVFTLICAYFNLYKLIESAKSVEENLKQINEHLREATLKEKSGIATKNDVLRWQLQVSGLELAQADIQNNIAISNFNLSLMLGLNENTKIITDSEEVNASFTLKSFEEYNALALEKRSDLAAAELHARASKNAMMVAQNSYLPRISLAGEFLNARPNPRYIPPVDELRVSWSAGVSLNWDLVSLYSNKHNVDEARSYFYQSLESSLLLTDNMKSEINQNFLTLKESFQKAEVMKKTMAQAEENYRLMNSRYRNSLALLSELLEANTQLLNAHINYSFAKADIQISYYRLLKTTGSIN